MISYTLRSEQTLSKLGRAAEFKTVTLRITVDIIMTVLIWVGGGGTRTKSDTLLYELSIYQDHCHCFSI